jgi:hypothetical protein
MMDNDLSINSNVMYGKVLYMYVFVGFYEVLMQLFSQRFHKQR